MSSHALHNDVAIDFRYDIRGRVAGDALHQDLERIIESGSAVVKCDSGSVYVREGDGVTSSPVQARRRF